jgi:ADP-ribose pyrophosphatase
MGTNHDLFAPRFHLSDVEIISKKRVWQGFFAIDQYDLRYPRFDGRPPKVLKREIFERDHDAVAVLPYDALTDEVQLIEQFRPGALSDVDSPWLIEVLAGMIDTGETPLEAAVREMAEETGLKVDPGDLRLVTAQYPSPGGCSERTTLYIANTDLSHLEKHGGLDSESEDIRVFKVSAAEAFAQCVNGRIHNAAALITLLYLQNCHAELRKEFLQARGR